MNCPSCGSGQTNVIDSHPTEDGKRTRRYICHSCGERFNTKELYAYEIPDTRRLKELTRALRKIRACVDQTIGGGRQ